MEYYVLDLLGIDGKVIVLKDIRVAGLVVEASIVIEVPLISS